MLDESELASHCVMSDHILFVPQVNSAWETLNKAWKERVETLEEAMQAAVQFQDSLQVNMTHTDHYPPDDSDHRSVCSCSHGKLPELVSSQHSLICYHAECVLMREKQC